MIKRSAPLTYEEVSRACYNIMVTGEKLTWGAIYQHLNSRGSKTTILKFRNRYLAEMKAQRVPPIPSSIPEGMQQLFEDFYFRALEEAAKAFALERSGYEEQIAVANDCVEKVTLELAGERAKAKGLISLSEADNSELLEACQERDLMRQELDRIKMQSVISEERHCEELAAIKQSHELEVKDFLREVEAYRLQAEESRDRLRSEYKRSENELDHWLIQIANERDNRKNAEDRATSTVSRYESELVIARARENRLVQRAEKSEEDVEQLRDRLSRLQPEGSSSSE